MKFLIMESYPYFKGSLHTFLCSLTPICRVVCMTSYIVDENIVIFCMLYIQHNIEHSGDKKLAANALFFVFPRRI